MNDLVKKAEKFQKEIIRIRREIHENPELSYKEEKTSSLVIETLRSLGVEVQTNVGLPTAVVGRLKGKGKGSTVALRADMDALPVKEETDLPFKSKVDGVMHACGHDTHVSMLLGAAMILSEEEFPGEVRLLFQPAEEDGGKGGAKPMIEAGAMKGVDYVFGIHISSSYPSGVFATRKGAFMAVPDSFTIRVHGRGGHGSAPHETVDPIHTSVQIANALYSVNRLVNPTKPFVLSITNIHSGTTDNVIPDEAFMQGTIRSLDEDVRTRALQYVKDVVSSTCSVYGAECEVKFMEDPYPITFNDPDVTEEVMNTLREISTVVETNPILGAEDFSRYLQVAPGTFFFLGTRNEKKGCVYPNHSSQFCVDEDVLKLGAAAYASLALKFTKEERKKVNDQGKR
ncbi:carboxypeptidase CpsA [Sulfuracidifex tepidarius]|uniref:Thermostable carboxypeptidase 1 n=1 Tax=Sulfuracidifex tepidarius TaxID=1294262 RepID=A0A510DXV7_9CREN|nr:carboxypeptidase CpsA [Sulfuracidifex tepidarius]BBG25043.1 Thermostable carboxypeptidase 1 [Sulfuracidifex tepidarius]BBG27824.1 Thermostable carboxypeptidase 1 [Sulfuracidifex tepidarius]